MLKKTVPTLIIAALAGLGTMQLAHAQKNYTDGGDIHSGSHTKKASPHANTAKAGKFDPYTDGARTVAGRDRTGVSAEPGRTADTAVETA